MKPLKLFNLIATVLLAASQCLALSVKPPLFEDLVRKADCIVRTEVLSTHCAWKGEGENRHIVTLIKLRVQECLVGQAQPEFELEQIGGTIGDRSLSVPGLPVFKPGDQDVLFIRDNGKTFCPLVGAYYGRYLVVSPEDQGNALIVRNDGSPLRSIAEVPVSMADHEAKVRAIQGTTLSLKEFESEIIRCAQSLNKTVTPQTR